MIEKPISTPFELFEEIRRLIQRAEMGGVERRHLDALFNAGEAIMLGLAKQRREYIGGLVEEGEDERRTLLRLQANTQAVAVVDDERLPVQILDLGARGFGILARQPIPVGHFLILEVPASEGWEAFSCFVAFQREKEGEYRIGLRLFAKLPGRC